MSNNIEKIKNDLSSLELACSKTYSKLRKVRQYAGVRVSDHALIRYLERVKGLEMETVIKEILTADLLKYHAQLGDGTFPTGAGGIRAVVKDGVVVTIKS